jgi:ribosomal protein L7/L12
MMSKCRFCDRDNPPGIDRCLGCGSWLEQGIPTAERTEEPITEPKAPAPKPRDELEEQVLALLRVGRKIEAIKIYRQRTGKGLKVSKDAVEALAAEHGISPVGAGCATAAVMTVLASAILGGGAWVACW